MNCGRRTAPCKAGAGSPSSATARPKQPLVYKRGNEEETLLVAINPYREEVSFRLDGTMGGALYTFGGEAAQKGETVTLPPVSAGVYGLKCHCPPKNRRAGILKGNLRLTNLVSCSIITGLDR